jgi:hypothetical protein
VSLDLNALIAAAKRSRNARNAGQVRRSNYPYATHEYCNKVKRGDPTQRCCRGKGHTREHLYITAVGPIIHSKIRKPPQ